MNILIPDLNKNNISKDNQELKEFFDNNNLNYMSKENRDISYVVIDKNSYLDKFMPSENEMINYFEEIKNFIQFLKKEALNNLTLNLKKKLKTSKVK